MNVNEEEYWYSTLRPTSHTIRYGVVLITAVGSFHTDSCGNI
jgi:hypothetical protein